MLTINYEKDLILGIRRTSLQNLEIHSPQNAIEAKSYLALLSLNAEHQLNLFCKHNHQILAKLAAQELSISQDRIQLFVLPHHHSGNCCQAIQILSATMRCLLVRSAAHLWNLSPGDCTLRAGRVRQLSKDFDFEFGELISTAKELDIPRHVDLRYQYEGLEI